MVRHCLRTINDPIGQVSRLLPSLDVRAVSPSSLSGINLPIPDPVTGSAGHDPADYLMDDIVLLSAPKRTNANGDRLQEHTANEHQKVNTDQATFFQGFNSSQEVHPHEQVATGSKSTSLAARWRGYPKRRASK